MEILEHTVVLMAKERMADAVRSAEQMRALYHARALRPAARVRVGMAIVRLGRWIQGHPSPAPGAPGVLRQAESR